jgi:histidinol phosphatase-like enzyme (inositol monophosphatase family)
MEAYISFAEDLVAESGPLIRRYFAQGVGVELKADQTPVTVADREAEALLRRRIHEAFPAHQVLGEEAGLSGPAEAAYRWVLDPIDGTKSFIHGVPLFGTLIALLHAGVPVLGVIHLPALDRLLIGAEGQPTRCDGAPVRVSRTAELAQATVLITSPGELFKRGYGPALARLAEHVRIVRSWGDCFGHFQVATGRADAMFDPILNTWDVAALRPCVVGAGGRLTDRDGVETGLGTSALSSNGVLHQALLDILQPE